jgi:hypothetical protein
LNSEKIWKIWKLNESNPVSRAAAAADRGIYTAAAAKAAAAVTKRRRRMWRRRGGESGGGGRESGGGGGFVIDSFPISGEPLNFDSVISVKVLGIYNLENFGCITFAKKNIHIGPRPLNHMAW